MPEEEEEAAATLRVVVDAVSLGRPGSGNVLILDRSAPRSCTRVEYNLVRHLIVKDLRRLGTTYDTQSPSDLSRFDST